MGHSLLPLDGVGRECEQSELRLISSSIASIRPSTKGERLSFYAGPRGREVTFAGGLMNPMAEFLQFHA